MPGELSLPLATLFGFLLVLARVSGVVIFVPIPGFQAAPEVARVALALGLSIILMPAWPTSKVVVAGINALPGLIGAEFAYGLILGLGITFLMEGAQIAAQMIGLQAGYSFASTIDPTTQADSGILQIIAQLLVGSLFFALGLDREIVRALAFGLEGGAGIQTLASLSVANILIQLSSQMFVVGLRLAMPVLALLILMDLSFAILGKVHAQFQALSLSFAAKMLAGLAMMAIILATFPAIIQSAADRSFRVLISLAGR